MGGKRSLQQRKWGKNNRNTGRFLFIVWFIYCPLSPSVCLSLCLSLSLSLFSLSTPPPVLSVAIPVTQELICRAVLENPEHQNLFIETVMKDDDVVLQVLCPTSRSSQKRRLMHALFFISHLSFFLVLHLLLSFFFISSASGLMTTCDTSASWSSSPTAKWIWTN